MNTPEQDPEFEALLTYISRVRGFDFTSYKRPSLTRRVNKRLQAVAVSSYSDYIDRLEVDPEEFVHLFNTILINVTSFFRDIWAWEYLESEIVPQIVARKEPQEPIRIWSAACASGQEAYTLAIVLAQVLGVEQFKRRVKIYATDLDQEALNQARSANYSIKEMTGLPVELRELYFERSNSHYTFRQDLRRSVIFGCHNLLVDAPISRIDLLVCRNTLMYFNAEAQARILVRFHFALNPGGFLFLGKAETLFKYSDSFTSVDLKRRVYIKELLANMRQNSLLMASNSNAEKAINSIQPVSIRDAAFDANPRPQVVVSFDGLLVLANERARTLFVLNPADVGRPVQDLECFEGPLKLPSYIKQAYAECQAVNIREVEWATTTGASQYFDVQVAPLLDGSDGSLLGATITFTDISHTKRLQQDLEYTQQEMEMAYEELQATNEELETMNEELQSSNEEMETTNEKLQSTNKEMETMNEELQSSNEELQTLNQELCQRSVELNLLNTLFEGLLASLPSSIVVVNQELRVLVWNNKAEDMWGLHPDEVQGQYLLNLDIGLPLESLVQPIRSCLTGNVDYPSMTLEAINRRGKTIECQVTCTPLVDRGQGIQGVILLMEQQRGKEP
jgi:two-component system CheB/CheR fusion protein